MTTGPDSMLRQEAILVSSAQSYNIIGSTYLCHPLLPPTERFSDNNDRRPGWLRAVGDWDWSLYRQGNEEKFEKVPPKQAPRDKGEAVGGLLQQQGQDQF